MVWCLMLVVWCLMLVVWCLMLVVWCFMMGCNPYLIAWFNAYRSAWVMVNVNKKGRTSLRGKFRQMPTYRDWETDRKSTRLNSSHITRSRMPSSA